MESIQILGISTDVLSAVANCIMAAGALLIFLQILQSRLQAKTEFEDTLNAEYRRIVHTIPARALLGEPLTEDEMNEYFDELLSYVDLCNEQAFLRQLKRIRGNTWRYWVEGMKSNFSRPAFHQAWEIIKRKSVSDFQELRKLEMSEFQDDPASWD